MPRKGKSIFPKKKERKALDMADTPPKGGGVHMESYSHDPSDDETQKPAKELVDDNTSKGGARKVQTPLRCLAQLHPL